MKKLNFSFLLIMAMGLFLASCTKEKLSTTPAPADEVQSAQDVRDQLQTEFDQYLAEHEEVSIEYTSLESLNEALAAEGLETITLEEIGVSEEEYANAQAIINNPNAAKERCTGGFAVFLGDMNNSGNITALDVVLVRKCRLGLGCVDPLNFLYSGYFSTVWGVDSNSSPTAVDEDTMIQIILGILPCF